MTPEQRALAFDLVITSPDGLRRISLEDFAKRFPTALDGGKASVTLLEEAIRGRNCEDLEAALLIGATFEFTAAHVVPLSQLLCANWHTAHEDIVGTLQRLRDSRTVEALYAAALVSHPYLAYDEFFGLARKCAWALADIGTPDAFGKLQLLAASANPQIAQYAQRRIDRWDDERHRKVASPE